MTGSHLRRLALAAAAAASLALLAAGSALAHAEVVPSTGLADGQLYALSVPNEIEGATTTRVVLTVPEGFAIDVFAESPGWERTVERTGDAGAIGSVTWRATEGGADEGAVFQFTGSSPSPGTFRFAVAQSYSDGTVVDWAGDEDSEFPASLVTTRSSLGGGGASWLALAALLVGGAGLVLGTLALVRRDGERPA
jgi:uncharacterized protein YcnI